jgi:hypothetical protein
VFIRGDHAQISSFLQIHSGKIRFTEFRIHVGTLGFERNTVR